MRLSAPSFHELSKPDRQQGERRKGWLPAATESLSAAHVATAYIPAVAVLTMDAFLPLGVAAPSLYLIPLAYLALWSTPKQTSPVFFLAGACSVLTVVGLLRSHQGMLWMEMANRGLTILLIAITTVLSLLRKRTEEDVKVLRGLLPICSYCKKIRNDRGYWEQVERYIAVRSDADFSHGMCPDCGVKHFPDVYDNGMEGAENIPLRVLRTPL